MMDPAFFVGKGELLAWLNDLLDLNYTKVEQCANGAAYCQIIDAVFPVRSPGRFHAITHRAALRRTFSCSGICRPRGPILLELGGPT